MVDLNPLLLPNPFLRSRLTPNTMVSLSISDLMGLRDGGVHSASEFEEKFARFIGLRHVVMVNSGRSALRLGLELLGVQMHEVIVPSLVCGVVADAILSAGGIPVLADVKPEDGTIDPDKLNQCFTEKTKAIIAVHYQGQACDMHQ